MADDDQKLVSMRLTRGTLSRLEDLYEGSNFENKATFIAHLIRDYERKQSEKDLETPADVFEAASEAAMEVVNNSDQDLGFVTMAAVPDPDNPERAQVRFLSNMPEQQIAQMCGQTARVIVQKLQQGSGEDSDIITPNP